MEELSKKSYKLLKDYYQNQEYRTAIVNDEFLCLHDADYIESERISFFDDNKQLRWKISEKGIIYVENRKAESKRWWIPVVISGFSTLIAIGAFIISIIALSKQ